jgi:hypothetical protein
LDNNGTLAYGTGATVKYAGSVQQTVGDEWTAKSGTNLAPDNVIVDNGGGLNLLSSILADIDEDLSLSNGAVDYNTGSLTLTVGGDVAGGNGSFGTGTNKAKLIVTGATGGSSAITSTGSTTLYDVTFSSTATNGSLKDVTIQGVLELQTSSNVTLAGGITVSTITLDGTLNLGGYAIIGNPAINFGSGAFLYTNGSSISSYTFNSDAGTVVFNGTSSEIIPGKTFYNLELDNSSGADVSTNSPVVNSTLTLTNGILTTTSGLISTASITGSFSTTRHVNGPLVITGTGSKTFPIGKNGIYKPVTVTNTSGATKFELFNADPSGTPVNPLQVISILRYWEGSGGSISGGAITLPYGGDDGGIVTESNLRVAKSSSAGGNYSSVGPAGGGSGGTITSDATLNSLGFFTLGSITTDNSLPVSLTSFTANIDHSKIILSWQTESEIENQGFNIYRTVKDEDDWSRVNTDMIPGQGNTAEKTTYEFTDRSAQAGITYEYRLESVSYTGVRVQEKVIEVMVPMPQEYTVLGNYPNPFNPTTNINFRLPESSDVSILIYGIQGNLVRELALNQPFEAGDHFITWDATDNEGQQVASGMYVYLFSAGKFSKTEKMLLLK